MNRCLLHFSFFSFTLLAFCLNRPLAKPTSQKESLLRKKETKKEEPSCNNHTAISISLPFFITSPNNHTLHKMSFLRKRPPVQSNRQQQARALAAGQASSNSGPTIKKKIPTSTTPQPVPGTYTDYKLVSTSRDVLHHVMRFHGQKIVTPNSFTAPVKLHRKKNENPHRGYYGKYSQYNQQQQQQAAKDATGDKKDGAASGAGTVGGATAGAPGGAAAPAATGANTALIAPYGGGVRNKQMLFKKRTRQIYIANEDERKKKEIEAAPWVLDDYDSQNNWTGQLEGGQGANYVLFVFAEDGFKVVPADKWYKFSPKLQYATLTAEEAEEQVRD